MRYLPSVCRDDVSESIVLAYHITLSLMADDTHLIDNKISICYITIILVGWGQSASKI